MYRHPAPLRNHEIIQIHNMATSGVSIADISRAMNMHRNNVTHHLRFRIAYPKSVIDKIAHLAPRIPTEFPCPVLDAAPLLPGWPAPGKIYDLMAAGVIKGTKRPNAEGRRTLYVTKSQIKNAARRMMPTEGVFLRSDQIERLSYLGSLQGLTRHHLAYWPNKSYFWIRSTEIKEQLHVPAAIVHLTNRCLDLTGRALLV